MHSDVRTMTVYTHVLNIRELTLISYARHRLLRVHSHRILARPLMRGPCRQDNIFEKRVDTIG